MTSSPRRRRRRPSLWRRFRQRPGSPDRLPWAWVVITALLYLSMGLLLAAFPVPYWIWNLALVGIVAQALALAGPRALSRRPWLAANLLALLAIIGTVLLAIALGISLGFVGTAQLDEVAMSGTTFEVIRIGLLAILVPAIGAVIGAETGDRLLYRLNRWQTTLVLAATCSAGIGLGGAFGLLIAG
ncbi:MAG: hypothetical protein ACFB0E_17775 [Leptolyngbyaceae cyanobacterium]